MPRSKSEPYAQSAVDLARLAKESLDEFFDIQVEDRGFMVQDLVNGLDAIFQEYISFVAGCGIYADLLICVIDFMAISKNRKFLPASQGASRPTCRAFRR